MAEREIDFTWRYDQQQAYNIMLIKAGQTTKLPAREALRMQLMGNGTIGKTLKPHVHDQAAFDRFMKEERAQWEAVHPELAPKPGHEPVFSQRQQAPKDGWIGP